jgi:vancomycin resistance protein VanJ
MGPYDPTNPPGTPPTPSPRRRLRALTTACCWVYLAAVLAVWLVLGWADPWWLATLVMFAPRWPLALPLAVLAPAALLLRPKLLALLLVTALLVARPVMGFCLPWQQLVHPSPPGKPFRVLTCNMHYSQADPTPLDTLIADAGLDVAAVQEWPASSRSVLQTAQGWHVHTGPRLFLASRHPIRRVVELGHASMGDHASVTRYVLETPLGLIHLFSLHLATARHGIADTIHENDKRPEEVRTNIARRREQSEFVAGQAGEVRGPLLLVGDFNTPPQSAFFSNVWEDYRDAFSWAGLGWGYTFFGAGTMVRIDHILAGKGWSCRHCAVGPYVGSPHHPVIGDLVWSNEASRLHD